MAYIKGWAFQPGGKEEAEKRRARYALLKAQVDAGELSFKIESKSPRYAQTHVVGKATPHGRWSALDILIFCDQGNTCFGGSVTKYGDGGFRATVHTD